MTSSSSEPDAEERFVFTLLGVVGRLGLGGLGVLGDRRVGGFDRLRVLLERLRVDGLARHLVVGRSRRGGLCLRRGIVQQARLDDLLRPRVAALADAGALADAATEVVELGAPDVAAGGHLDALDLGRVHGERALDADAEGLLADGEGLADPLALALDDDALEHLGTTAGALDDLEVNADAVAGLEGGDAAELRALQGVDYGAHGEENAAREGPLRRRRIRIAKRRRIARRGCATAPPATPGSGRDARSAGPREPSTRASRRDACSAGTPAPRPARRRTTPRAPSP